MTEPTHDIVEIPTPEALRKTVVSRRKISPPSLECDAAPAGAPCPPKLVVSTEGRAFLDHAVHPHHRHLSLEDRWSALGIRSGSVKKRVLAELRGLGFIRLERKGRYACLHLYRAAYEFLGLEPPTREGVGGTTHRALVKAIAKRFRARGYDVQIEAEIGVTKKRVDAVCMGRKKIGVEVGLSDVRQEMKNLREDLGTGVLDLVLFVATDAHFLQDVRQRAWADPELRSQWNRIRFYFMEKP